MTFVLNKGATVIVCVVLAAVLGFSRSARADFSANCSVNGLGSGTCTFTNNGNQSGSTCVRVTSFDIGRTIRARVRVCSGIVAGRDVVQRTFGISIDQRCWAVEYNRTHHECFVVGPDN